MMENKTIETTPEQQGLPTVTATPDRHTRTTQQWEMIMQRFSDSHKKTCKSQVVSLSPDQDARVTVREKMAEMPRMLRSAKHFPTGSEYEGTWNILGMSGFGTYTFPHVKYIGSFEDGMFHGEGELRYDNGTRIRGTWKNGVIKNKKIFFGDGLEYYEKNWPFVRPFDRRFPIEYDTGLQPADKTYKTAAPFIDIPDGYYDVGDGFYDPRTEVVYKYDDLTSVVRAVSSAEHSWILQNCRKSPLEPIGPVDLYEEWQEPVLKLEKPEIPAMMTDFMEEIQPDSKLVF